MSLICEEHGHNFGLNDAVFCMRIRGSSSAVAICREAVKAIPVNARSRRRIRKGVDIYAATSTPHPSGIELSLFGLKLRRRCFSVTREVAAKHLPHTYQRCSA